MGSTETYGYVYVYANGLVRDKPVNHRRLILNYHYSANDGWRMIRRGEETELHIEIGRNVSYEELEIALKHPKIDKEARPFIREMIKSGAKSRSFALEEKIYKFRL